MTVNLQEHFELELPDQVTILVRVLYRLCQKLCQNCTLLRGNALPALLLNETIQMRSVQHLTANFIRVATVQNICA